MHTETIEVIFAYIVISYLPITLMICITFSMEPVAAILWIFFPIIYPILLIRKKKPFTIYKDKNGGWFRLFGYGYSWSICPSFSQRQGLAKVYRIGKWWISPLENKASW